MTKNSIPAYTIDEISNWQTDIKEPGNINNEKAIRLPSLQRGFVWKPYQIESLWDSILRGYPIGSILVSNSNDFKDLLDGQQRSTSIALAYYNPITDNNLNFFNVNSNKSNNGNTSIIPSVWIDLSETFNNKYGQKFAIRVLTKSHPWGYSLYDHRNTLSSSDRNNALKFFREKQGDEKLSFTEIKNEVKNPWDAKYPVPLSVLLKIDTDKFENWNSKLNEFIYTHLSNVKTKNSANNSYVDYDKVSEKRRRELWSAVKLAKQILIPEIEVKSETLQEDEDFQNENTSTLFIRLNSEGTAISGEELVYSLFKATFPESKNLVEQIGFSFIKPSKVISIISKVILSQKEEEYSFQKDVNIVRFRKEIMNSAFKGNLKEFIEGKKAESLFKEAIEFISYNKDIPQIFYKDTIINSVNLFYVFVLYLRRKSEDGSSVTGSEKEFIHRSFVYLSKFGSKDKEVSKKLFSFLKSNNFSNWENAVRNLLKEHPEIVTPPLKPEEFNKFLIDTLLINYKSSEVGWFSNENLLKELISNNKEELNFLFPFKNSSSFKSDEITEEETINKAMQYWLGFSHKIYWDKSLLLVAQAKYFNNEFKDYIQFESIEDTNRPWDWDHIYPNSWVYRKGKISEKVRKVINLNGNFRALSFNENRSESNHKAPKDRFDEKEEVCLNSFIKNDLEYWKKLDEKSKRIKSGNDQHAEALIDAIFHRMANIYKAFYEKFNLE